MAVTETDENDLHSIETKKNDDDDDDDNSNTNTRPILYLFDLDGTLYDQKCGYVDHVHNQIFEYMFKMTGNKFDDIDSIEKAKEVWKPIFQKYNLTKRGLIGEGYKFDPDAYDKFIRRDASKYIKNDPQLRLFLQSLPSDIPKVIFTNAPEFSAYEILKLLGVDDLFDDDVLGGSIFLQDQICKPEKEAFELVLQHLKIKPKDYSRVWFFEDSYTNLIASKQLFGMKTVYIKSSRTIQDESANENKLDFTQQFDAVIEGKVGMELKQQLPQLWG